MSFIKNMMKATGNEYAALVDEGIEINDVENYIDTGCYALNAILSGSIYGGIADNKITALAGDSGVGKSMVSLGIVKSFLDKNKDGICMYFESEAAITSDMVKNFGIDTKRIAVIGVSTVEEFRNQVIKIADEYLQIEKESRKPMLLILDSLGMLSTSKEMADTAEGKDTTDMTRARVIKSIFRVLTLKLGKARIPLLLTNHTYNTLSMYATKVQSGGCLTTGHKVTLHDNSYKDISEIKIGEYVKTLNEPQKVINTFKFDNKEVYKITFEDGSSVECTPEHKFLRNTDFGVHWEETETLIPGDSLVFLD